VKTNGGEKFVKLHVNTLCHRTRGAIKFDNFLHGLLLVQLFCAIHENNLS